MKIQSRIAAVGCTLLLGASCASAPSPQVQAKRAEFERTIPTCAAEKDCEAKWEAAQVWVVKNAGYKIQTATNVLIETYNSIGSSTDVAVRVLKEPLGSGSYRFVVNVWCANIFGCFPNPWDAALDFNRTLNSVSVE